MWCRLLPMTGRRRHWLSYLMLTLVVVGASAHGFLPQAAERMQADGVASAEGTTLVEHGTLPTIRGVRPLTDARKSRTAPGGGADDCGAAPSAGAARLPPRLTSDIPCVDLGRRSPATIRAPYQPRGPPAST